MKEEATKQLETIIQSWGHSPQNIHLIKLKQSNKKPCYTTRFDLENCSISGFVFQKNDKEWTFNFDRSSTVLDAGIFSDKVQDAVIDRIKLNQYLAKQEKINLTHADIKEKTIEIKEARKLKMK